MPNIVNLGKSIASRVKKFGSGYTDILSGKHLSTAKTRAKSAAHAMRDDPTIYVQKMKRGAGSPREVQNLATHRRKRSNFYSQQAKNAGEGKVFKVSTSKKKADRVKELKSNLHQARKDVDKAKAATNIVRGGTAGVAGGVGYLRYRKSKERGQQRSYPVQRMPVQQYHFESVGQTIADRMHTFLRS